MATQNPPTIILHFGIVKQVLSGDAVVLRGLPKLDGPPAERQLNLTNIIAPRLGRRPTPMMDGTPDEPYAWEAREYLRKKVIGREVCFTIDYKVPGSGREYGNIYLGKDIYGENLTECLIKEGLVEVRKGGMRMNEENSKMVEWEEAAKSAGKGKWGKDDPKMHVREIVHNIPNLRNFVDSFAGEPVKGIVEHVRDGSSLRIILLPSYHTITLMISGIKCPSSRREGEQEVTEPFFEEARYFTESRLLQREVDVIMEGVSNQAVTGTVLHAKGNIAEFLLKEGLAKCVDWSMATVSYNTQRLKTAEKFAKENHLRMWKDYTPVDDQAETKDHKAIQAKVIEIVNAECMMVKVVNTGEAKKIFLSSIRGPKADDNAPLAEGKPKGPNSRPRPLYDIPYLFDAREFLRKKLIGKKVNVSLDYLQPASINFPEKACCTVTLGGVNVAGALVSKGLATVVRYRQDDDRRSPCYDELLAAEAQAAKKQLGLHATAIASSNNNNANASVKFAKDSAHPGLPRIIELAGDVVKARQFWPFLQRTKRFEAVVEYVAGGSRLRLYLPKETCILTFLLAGINCPKGQRPIAGGGLSEAEPFADEAFEFTKDLCMQRDVEIEVESMDRAGNVIGWLFTDGNKNLSVSLVQACLATVHFSAERSPYASQLYNAQSQAQATKQKVWSIPENHKIANGGTSLEDQEGEEGAVLIEGPGGPSTDLAGDVNGAPETNSTGAKQGGRGGAGQAKPLLAIVITEIVPDTFNFYAQFADRGNDLIQMMSELRREINEQPSTIASTFIPKKGELCAAKFVDDEWYRARIEKINGPSITVLYIDYGNREVTDVNRITMLPMHFASIAPQAKEYALACVLPPTDEDSREEALHQFRKESYNQEFLVNVEYRIGNLEYVTLFYPLKIESSDSVPKVVKGEDFVKKKLVGEGFLLAEPRKERRLFKLVDDYKKAQETAKLARRNLWRYGDFTPDDAFEFGFKKSN